MEPNNNIKPKFLLIKDNKKKDRAVYRKVDNETRIKLIEMVGHYIILYMK